MRLQGWHKLVHRLPPALRFARWHVALRRLLALISRCRAIDLDFLNIRKEDAHEDARLLRLAMVVGGRRQIIPCQVPRNTVVVMMTNRIRQQEAQMPRVSGCESKVIASVDCNRGVEGHDCSVYLLVLIVTPVPICVDQVHVATLLDNNHIGPRDSEREGHIGPRASGFDQSLRPRPRRLASAGAEPNLHPLTRRQSVLGPGPLLCIPTRCNVCLACSHLHPLLDWPLGRHHSHCTI